MAALDIDEIKRDAAGRVEFARKMDELQSLASRVFPGSRLMLITGDARLELQNPFATLSGMDQIMTVLSEIGGGPIELQVLHGELVRKGSTMSLETLMSQLSRGKDVFFINPARGIWGSVTAMPHRSARVVRGETR